MVKVKFHIPGLFEHWPAISYVIQTYSEKNYMFYDWVELGSFYGCSNDIILTGGRVPPLYCDMEGINDWMQVSNMNASLILTNSVATEEYFDDENTNKLLEMFHRNNNSVVVANDLFEKYIREKYPLYKICSSVTKVLDKDKIIEELEKPYELVCLLHDFNKDVDWLNSLPHKDKIELIPNHTCYTGQLNKCKMHYDNMSECILHKQFNDMHKFGCTGSNGNFFEMIKKPYFISAEEIPIYAEKYGIYNFKLSGRHFFPHDIAEMFAYYLIKPEYQMEFRTKMFF